jgi:hypothetical protein
MKKLIRTILITLLVSVFAFGIVGCNNQNAGSDSEKGLILKRYENEDFYTVYDYVDDGKTSSLTITSPDELPIGRIAENAFDGVNTLTELVIPSTVTEIGQGAFKNMKNLNKLTVPFIGLNATADAYFNQTQSGEDKAVDATRTISHFFGSDEYVGGVLVTNNYNKTGNTSVFVPATLNTITINNESEYAIPMYAFSGVINLGTVNLSNKITAIGVSAFEGCLGLANVQIPASVKTIYDSAFSGCTNLGNLTFADNQIVETFGDKAFYGITLKNFTLPESVKTIGEMCFASSNLRVVNLSNVEKIGWACFAKCAKLNTISATNSVELSDYAFYQCEQLTASGIANLTYTNGDFAFIESGVRF